MPATIRPGRAQDVEPLADLLIAAFEGDPFMTWIVGPARDARATQRAMFIAQAQGYLAIGGLDIAEFAGVMVGGAFWARPGQHLPLRHRLRMGRALARPLLRWTTLRHPTDLRHWANMRRGLRELGRATPRDAYYLDTIGTAPATRAARAGTALMHHRLAEADAAGKAVYLESSKESNVGFYRRFGFAVARVVPLPGGPSVWTMLRPARDRGHPTEEVRPVS